MIIFAHNCDGSACARAVCACVRVVHLSNVSPVSAIHYLTI